MSRHEQLSVGELIVENVIQDTGAVTFTVGAEAADVINVAVQMKAAKAQAMSFYLADDAAGLTPSASAPAGGIAIGTDGALIENVANLSGMVITEATGAFDIDLTNATTAPTFYLVVVLPGGNLAVSPAITFAA